MFKGIIFNVICNLFFVVVGYLIHFAFGATMTPAEYGIIGSILTILDFEYLFLNNGVRQSISKEISSEKYNIKDVILKGVLFQFILIAIIFAINYFGAGLFAKALNDTSIEKYIRFAAFLIPFNGLYVITMGINEGIHRFTASAVIGIVYSLFKLSVIPYVIFVFTDAVYGAEAGYLTGIIAALIMGIITLLVNKKYFYKPTGRKIDFKLYAKNTLNFSMFFIIVSVVLSVDTLMVKSLVEDKNVAGYYTGAVSFAKVSYFILSAFFTIMLPTITSKFEKGEKNEASKIIRNVIVIILSFVMPIAVILSSTSGSLLISFYRGEYIAAQNTLMILVWSHFFMGITVMFNMIIAAANKKRFSTILAGIVVVVDIVVGYILTRRFGMIGMAVTGTVCTFLAMVASIWYSRKLFTNMFTKQHLIILISNIILWIIIKAVFTYYSTSSILILGAVYIGVYVFYILLLNICKIINIKKLIKSVIQKNE